MNPEQHPRQQLVTFSCQELRLPWETWPDTPPGSLCHSRWLRRLRLTRRTLQGSFLVPFPLNLPDFIPTWSPVHLASSSPSKQDRFPSRTANPDSPSEVRAQNCISLEYLACSPHTEPFVHPAPVCVLTLPSFPTFNSTLPLGSNLPISSGSRPLPTWPVHL